MEKRLLWFGLAIFAVVVIAIGFRFYDIQNYPPGLFPDEAANGEDALLILEGDYRAFYPRGNGREGLFFYLEAAAIKLFGAGVWQLHAVSAAVGVLTILATYFATQAFFGRLAGTLAALFAATSHWHTTLSRTGFRAILAPLFIAAFTAFVGYAIKSAKDGKRAASYVYAALAGACFAGGFYSYIAYRAMVGVVLGVLVILLLAALHERIGFPHFRRYGGQIVIGLIAAVIVIAPLGWYFIQNPDEFIGRAGQVSVFNPELQREVGGGTLAGTLTFTTRETAKSFFAGEGDSNWRHGVPGYPLLNPLTGLLFLLGLAWTLWGTLAVIAKVWRGEEVHLGMVYPYLLLLLAGMLVPVITTAEGIPHGLRSLSLLFPIFMLAGTAGAVLLHWLQVRLKSETAQAVGYGLVIGALLVASVYDGTLYFLMARNDSDAHYAYRADLTEVAEFLRNRDDRPYLVLDAFSVQTVHFLTSVRAHDHVVGDEPHPDADEHLYRLLLPERSHEMQLTAGEMIAFTQSTLPDADRYAQTYTNIELVESRRNRFGQEIMRIYRGTGAPGEAPATFDLDA